MTSAELLPATVLKRKALVYVRQSTQTQVQNNLESRRRSWSVCSPARDAAVASRSPTMDVRGRLSL